jgi:Kdo2-lipid IVA lauroyltransferase/acyltransferase
MAFENYAIYRIGLWLLAKLPRVLVYMGAGVIAELNFAFNRTGRRGAYANQRRALPPDTGWFKRWRYARASFRHFAYSIVDFFRIPNLRLDNLDRYVSEIWGLEHAQRLQEQGHGGIFMTVHMGSWEMAGAAMALKGLPLTAAALKHTDPRIDAIFEDTRPTNIEIVYVGGAMPKLEDALTRGRFIGLLADRDVKRTGAEVIFFGEKTTVPTGHVKLAMRHGAAIIPVITYRVRDFRIVIDIREPILVDPATDTEEGLTDRCLRVIEDLIREHPDQWLSFFDLWDRRRRPTHDAHADD